MKVIRNTPEQLIVEGRPILLAVAATAISLIFVTFGAVLLSDDPYTGIALVLGGLVMGFGLNAAFVRRNQLILDRPGNRVELRRKSMLRYSQRFWDLSDLDRAEVETSHGGDTAAHRPVLIITSGMDAGTHPVRLTFISGRSAQHCVDAVNTWLKTAANQSQ